MPVEVVKIPKRLVIFGRTLVRKGRDKKIPRSIDHFDKMKSGDFCWFEKEGYSMEAFHHYDYDFVSEWSVCIRCDDGYIELNGKTLNDVIEKLRATGVPKLWGFEGKRRRVERILAKLARRARWKERASDGAWCPNPRPELYELLRDRLAAMRKVRNADPRWKQALDWADEEVGAPKAVRRRRAKPPEKIRRRKTETDEAFAKRFDLLTHDETDEHYAKKLEKSPRRTRREAYRAELYKQRRIYWGTWNALVKSVDQARNDVLKSRKNGVPAEIRRPKYRDPVTLTAERGGIRIIEQGELWWTLELRVGGIASTDTTASAKGSGSSRGSATTAPPEKFCSRPSAGRRSTRSTR
jgi:hypothetical protein